MVSKEFPKFLLDGLDQPAFVALSRSTSELRGHKLSYADVELWLARFWKAARRLGLDKSPPLDILDIGIGPGYFLYVCQQLGHRCVGIDRPGDYPFWQAVRQWLGVRNVVEHTIEPFKLLPKTLGTFDLVTAFRAQFNYNDEAKRLWNFDEWSFFLDDLRDSNTQLSQARTRIPIALAHPGARRGASHVLDGGGALATPRAAPGARAFAHRRHGDLVRAHGARLQERHRKALGRHHGRSGGLLRMTTEPETKNLSARVLAVRVLERVERDGAYAAAALDAELDRHPQLDVRDRGLLAELVYGVLRTELALSKRLLEYAPRGVTDGLVLRHLLVAAYQMLLLDRVPHFAAVDEAIGDIRRARGPRVAGFGNAVLRKLSAGPKLELARAVRDSAPAWLFAKLEAAVGAPEAEALFGAGVPLGRVWARAVAGASVPAWLEAAERHRVAPLARRLPGGDPEKLEGFAEGAFVVQEPGAAARGAAARCAPRGAGARRLRGARTKDDAALRGGRTGG